MGKQRTIEEINEAMKARFPMPEYRHPELFRKELEEIDRAIERKNKGRKLVVPVKP